MTPSKYSYPKHHLIKWHFHFLSCSYNKCLLTRLLEHHLVQFLLFHRITIDLQNRLNRIHNIISSLLLIVPLTSLHYYIPSFLWFYFLYLVWVKKSTLGSKRCRGNCFNLFVNCPIKLMQVESNWILFCNKQKQIGPPYFC